MLLRFYSHSYLNRFSVALLFHTKHDIERAFHHGKNLHVSLTWFKHKWIQNLYKILGNLLWKIAVANYECLLDLSVI